MSIFVRLSVSSCLRIKSTTLVAKFGIGEAAICLRFLLLVFPFIAFAIILEYERILRYINIDRVPVYGLTYIRSSKTPAVHVFERTKPKINVCDNLKGQKLLYRYIPTIHIFTRISRQTQSKSYMLSLTECVREFRNNAF